MLSCVASYSFSVNAVGIALSTFGGTSRAAPTDCRPLSDKPIEQIIISAHASLTTDGFISIDFEMNPVHEFLNSPPCTGDPDGPAVRTNVSSNLCGVARTPYSHTNCDTFGPHAFLVVAPCSLTQDLVVGWSLRYEQRWCNLGVNPKRKKGTVTVYASTVQALYNGGGSYNVTSTIYDDPVPE